MIINVLVFALGFCIGSIGGFMAMAILVASSMGED